MESTPVNDILAPGAADMEKRAFDVDVEEEKHAEEKYEVLDNKYPFPPLNGVPTEEQQLSFRAIIIGCCLGAGNSTSQISVISNTDSVISQSSQHRTFTSVSKQVGHSVHLSSDPSSVFLLSNRCPDMHRNIWEVAISALRYRHPYNQPSLE